MEKMQKSRSIAAIFLTVFISGLVFLTPTITHAQTIQCDTPEQKVACQAALDQVNADLAQAQKDLATAKAKSSSLSNDIATLDAKIKAEQLDIKAKNLLIQTLGNDITTKQSHINDLEANIVKGKDSIAQILRKTNEIDDYSLPEIILSETSLSKFFTDVDTFQAVQDGLKSTFEQLRSDEASTSAEKDALTVRQNATLDAKHAIVVEQANVQSDKTDQTKLLNVSKGNEASYSAVAAQKALLAAQIKAALFPLAGSKAIPFGDALAYANQVYNKLGVPPAFLLAILKQETNIGANVGTCYMTNTSDGSGINTRTNAAIQNVMKPTRDVQPFIAITQSLGYDYKTTVVSCPQSIGYGGGMGPAQFIASTWVLLKNRLATVLGVSTPNPWQPLDAFMAAGIYLSDLGANSSYSAQKNAACKYYSGSACKASNGSSNYGASVMALADSLEQNINILQGQ